MNEHASQNYGFLHVLESASQKEREAFIAWAKALLGIRNCDEPTTTKLNNALLATKAAEDAWPLIEVVANELKRYNWDRQGNWTRWALSGETFGPGAFDSHTAGMQALRSAVGLPAWVVLGAGEAYLTSIIEEFQNMQTPIDESNKI